MLRRFSARGFGCLEDVSVALTPLHAFIGPNDSGKSTLLRAVELLCVAAGRRESDGARFDDDERVRDRSTGFSLAAESREGDRYAIAGEPRGELTETLRLADGREHSQKLVANGGGLSSQIPDPEAMRAFSGARLLRLWPAALREKGTVFTGQRPLGFTNENGAGLPTIYDEILGRAPEEFIAIRKEFLRLFPAVKRVQLVGSESSQKAFRFEMKSGRVLSTKEVSEGLLYYLAFAALRHLDPVAVLCVEEPENGLHPARIRDVVKILREVSESGTQVLLSTHSPLLVNELFPSEVTLLTRPSGGGTVATRLDDVPGYATRADGQDLLPGEFWVRYCDGEAETELLAPSSATEAAE